MGIAAQPVVWRFLAVFVTVCTLGEAHAAALWNLGRGASTFSRGGANIARPRDPNALHTNPAALAGLSGLQLMLDGNFILDNRSFARDDQVFPIEGQPPQDWPDLKYDPVENDHINAPSPGVFATYSIPAFRPAFKNLTVGMGVFGPPETHTSFPADGAQRYDIIRGENLQIQYALGMGFELKHFPLRFGATFLAIEQVVNQSQALHAGFGVSTPENPGFDATVDIDASGFARTGIFGFAVGPIEGFTLAGSYQHKFRNTIDGTVDIAFGEDLEDQASIIGDELQLIVRSPSIARAAVRYDAPDEAFDIEAAVVWEFWSSTGNIEFIPQDINVEIQIQNENAPLDPFTIKQQYRDTYSLRLGGSYLLTESIRLRAGGFYERAAVGKHNVSLSTFDLDKIGGGLGARIDLGVNAWYLKNLWFDLGGGYVHWFSRDVDESKTRIVNVLADPPTDEWPLGNGTYTNRHITFVAAIGGHFSFETEELD